MLSMDSVKPEKWYSVDEVSGILRISRDAVIRQIHAGNLAAFILPVTSKRRKRVYRSYRVQGSELIRFVSVNMTRAAA